MSEVLPFAFTIPDEALDDLRDRLQRTRWPEAETVDDWNQGIPLSYTKELADYWLNAYDWRARESMLNRFEHFKTGINGLGIHFIHARSKHENAIRSLRPMRSTLSSR